MQFTCKWCGETKDESELVRRSAKLPYTAANIRNCKTCNYARNRMRYKNPEFRKKQLRANAKWRAANPDKMARYTEKFYEKNPNQQRARSRVGYLVRNGLWKRQPCCVCGSTVQVEAHHDSYAEAHWETVRWLCKTHHEAWHSIVDPIKREVADSSLERVESMKKEATEVISQISELRKKHSQLLADAAALELQTWNRVIEKTSDLFNTLER